MDFLGGQARFALNFTFCWSNIVDCISIYYLTIVNDWLLRTFQQISVSVLCSVFHDTSQANPFQDLPFMVSAFFLNTYITRTSITLTTFP